MLSRRLAPPSAVLAVFLVAGCGGATSTSAPVTTASAPAVPSQAAPAAPGSTATGDASSPSAADSAPIDATCPTANTTAFAKTKFVGHAGLAFGAFHRYLYKPYKASAFQSGAKGRTVTLVKAGASALFIKREIRLATEDVKANPALCNAVAAPLANVGNTIGDAFSKLKSGDASGLEAAQTAVTSIESKASRSGDTIT